LAWADGDDIILYGKEVVRRSGLRLRGNVHALLAASVVCDTCGVSPGEIGKAMQTFTPLPHRLEVVGVYNGVQYINDSLATIPEATVHALDALGTDVVTLIAGGFDRRLSYEALGKRLAKSSVTALILFPDTGKKIWESLVRAHATPSIQKYDVSSMEEAVTLAVKLTPKGKICLLSPASASFNLFRDYADRGDQFKEWVKKLGPGSTS
jgi:UDP-N-acetylmuramoylalanine--D-glutamate ligase